MKQTCFMSKATSVPQIPQTNHSQCSSPVEALNLIVESKSQPFELDNLTIELHPVTARLQNTRPLTVGLKILLPQSRSHQINIKTDYKPHEISMYLSFFKHCIDYGTAALR